MAGQNRIVVDYGDYEGLVLLAAFDNETGKEVDRSELEKLDGFDLVKKYDGISDVTNLKGMIADNAEGFIIRFRNGMRMKIKGEEYVRLHKIVTKISTIDVWEYLRTGRNMNELVDRVPDEFDYWIKEVVKDLCIRFENIKRDYTELFNYCMSTTNSRREFADKAGHYRYSSILFHMYDGKDVDDLIWKIIKPKHEKPFRSNESVY